MDRGRRQSFYSAQPEGKPEETEYKEKQQGSFQVRWGGWVESGVVRVQKGGTRSFSGRTWPWIIPLLLLDVKSERWFCPERDVVVVGHRRRQPIQRGRSRPLALT